MPWAALSPRRQSAAGDTAPATRSAHKRQRGPPPNAKPNPCPFPPPDLSGKTRAAFTSLQAGTATGRPKFRMLIGRPAICRGPGSGLGYDSAMPKVLSATQVAHYRRDGFHFPVSVLSTAEARSYRDRLEANERTLGGPLSGNMRQKPHLLFTWANELARHPKILDAVEDVIGPDILCWSTTFFTKEAHSPSFVSWHQDATYWGLSTNDVITAWVAFADAPVESGAMKFWPGSHLKNQLEHRDTFASDNLLTPRPGDRRRRAGRRGRRRAAQGRRDVAASRAAGARLGPQHHRPTGASATPSATSRRMFARSRRANSAMLVRGPDRYGNFDARSRAASATSTRPRWRRTRTPSSARPRCCTTAPPRLRSVPSRRLILARHRRAARPGVGPGTASGPKRRR